MRFTAALSLILLAACATTPPAATTTTTTTTPATPAATAPPARSANALTPVASVTRSIAEPRISVGLQTDQTSVTFPRLDGGYFIAGDGGASTLRRGFTVTAPLGDSPLRYTVQASTISDSNSARAYADKVAAETSLPVQRVFDTAGGAYRILVGSFATEDEARPVRDRLVAAGHGRDMLIVKRPATEQFEKRFRIVDDEGDQATIAGENLVIMPVTADTLTLAGGPYRTSGRLFINERGLLNVINELNMEDYLLGVVPAEMGPSIYDELEALKAQATAARTYAFRNLGQYRREGYDICPGPACQAYKGFAGEHALSSQAVRETANMVIAHNGILIDALYTSTCGGETSDVNTMFPGRNEPYLRRARCVELETIPLAGRADSGLLTETQVNARLFALLAGLPENATGWSAADVQRGVAAGLRLAGAAPSEARPASSRRGDVLRYLATVMRLAEKGRVLTMPEDRKYFFPETANPHDEVHTSAAFLIKYGVLPAQYLDRVDLSQAMPREELYSLLGAWLREHGVLVEANAKIHRLNGRAMSLKGEGKVTNFTLPAGIPVFRRVADRFQEYKTLQVMVGDRATVLQNGQKVPVAVVVQANYDGASFDRTSNFANWTRSYRAEELVPVINRRNPIQQLIDIRPVTIDASQRIAELEVTAEGGRTFMLRGLPVRWSLNTPDNLFSYEKTKDPDGMDRYTFFGKGWGHGTGFCQVGSYGMAFRGYTYDQILRHYYTGVQVVPFDQARK
ncbi:MAG TPA: SpoIID/LytB domain-containing protein [Thermoanaerobaculia bacterium]